MPISPLMEDTTAFNFRILIDGKQLDDSINIFKIEVNSKLGEIPSATVTFVFQVESALLAAMEELAPGKNMELRMGYNGRDERLFSGIATNQSIAPRESQGFTLVADFQDKAFTLDQELDKQLFRNLTDAEIISTIINENGLPSDVDNTNVRHQQLSQFQMTDWDFIQARAKANNLLAYAENGKIFVKASATSSAPALLLTLGEDVIDFKLNTKASDLQSLRVSARNMLAKKKSVARKSRRVPGNTQSSVPAHTITGEVTFTGNATPQLNSTIQLAEFGSQFDGKHLITGFHHLAEAGQWKTTVDIGSAPAAANATAP